MTSRRKPLRAWTEAEQKKLCEDYFTLLPGACPVCAQNVGMMMDYKEGVPTVLKLRCRGCGNKADVAI